MDIEAARHYIAALERMQEVVSKNCISGMRIYYETYVSNFSSFIDIYKYLGSDAVFEADVFLNGTSVTYTDASRGDSGVVVFETNSKHHVENTGHYIANKGEILRLIYESSVGDICMLFDDCTISQNYILPSNSSRCHLSS